MKKQLLFLGSLLTCLTALNAQDVTNGLEAKYTFDQDSIQDVVGTNHGVSTEVTYTTGIGGAGKSIVFDGNDGGPTATISRGVIDNEIVDFSNDLTISFWFNLNDYNLTQPMVILSSRRDLNGDEAGGIEFVIRKDPNNTLQIGGRSVTNGLTLEYDLESSVIQTNQWYFVTFVQNAGTTSLYINGSQVDSNISSNPAEQNFFWALGGSLKANETTREFKGLLDEVRFYNRSLTPQEVTQLYNFDPSTADLNDETMNSEVSVHPNPFTNQIFVESTLDQINYSILDISGKLLSKGITTSNQSIDVSSLNSGVYFLKIFEGNKSRTIKVIKN
tara:strand:+ start:776 stop:1768 length:993 start_codon:yes stop_codon:yes gene_type:complete